MQTRSGAAIATGEIIILEQFAVMRRFRTLSGVPGPRLQYSRETDKATRLQYTSIWPLEEKEEGRELSL